MNNKDITFMTVLTVGLMISSMFVGLIGLSGIENVNASYTSHNPIRINNNTEFATMAGLEGWTGNGSSGNPYIIEGYDINGSGYGYCIYIGNTTVHFVVRDSYFHEANGVGSFPYYYDSGIILNNVHNGIIVNNTSSSIRYSIQSIGILLCNSTNNTIVNNNASINLNGINLEYSTNNTIANNTASNYGTGIILFYSTYNTITNNNASNNRLGIDLESSSSNIIANNNASNNNWGICLDCSSNNTIANNTASSNYLDGIFFIHLCIDNTITNNTISYNSWGIYMHNSSSTTIANNEMVDDGIFIRGDILEYWNTHIIDTTNTVNGKPIHYWKNRTGGTVPPGAGQVILANSTNVFVENQSMSDTSVGIILGFSNCNTITNNTASNNGYGIFLHSSDNNTITNNTVSNNYNGIDIGDTSGEISSNNSIYHNNMMNNMYQAFDFTINDNQWDNGYPSGGNYWSDYSGVDNYKGPNQDIPGSDGIGDTPHVIEVPVIDVDPFQDNYPLMEPYTSRTFENYTILKQGWNLVSIPLIQEKQSLLKVLEMIDGYYDTVEWYDIVDDNDHWKINNTDKLIGNDLHELNETMGFWIYINQPGDTIFLYNGTQPTENQTINLHPGWNLVGYPSKTSYNRTQGLNDLTFGTHVDSIWTFDAATQKWEYLGESDYFEPGRGYWINAKVECEWEVPL